jgi:transcription antitermination factor NusG
MPLNNNFDSGDQVEVTSGNFYMGKGTITSVSHKGNEKIASVEMFDGTFYDVPFEELSRLFADDE